MRNVVIFVFVSIIFLSLGLNIYAHNYKLTVSYEECKTPTTINGVLVDDERWYYLHNLTGREYHIGENTLTISYYFVDTFGGYSWDTHATPEEVQDIKEAYANSMKKWNSIYYYSYDNDGNRIVNKVINIVEGNEDSHNIEIRPINLYFNNDSNDNIIEAQTEEAYDKLSSGPNSGEVNHSHYDEWYMYVNVPRFYAHDGYYDESSGFTIDGIVETYANHYRERAGAHEMGHVLGLFDVDEYCSSLNSQDHHEELLMGYGTDTNRVTRPTYKDIAGVSITRGFHTDADHIWMLRDNLNDDSSHNSYDVICALCNGVKFGVDNDITVNGTNYTYLGEEVELFGSCNGEHSITGGNMLLVATDMVRDFYKCLHCRYIEEAEHTNHVYSHQWKKYDNTYHIEQCGCGATGTHKALHAIRASEIELGKAPCIGCGGMIRISPIDGFTPVIQNVQKVSINGSYISPNGVIVLVDEDVEAYYNGTLVFYDKDNLPQTE